MRDELKKQIFKIYKRNKKTVFLTADHGFDFLKEIYDLNIDRFINVGISEQTLISTAAGIAKSGLIPIVYGLSSLVLTRAYDQLRIDFGNSNLPLTILGDGAGLTYSNQGFSHHGIDDLGLINSLNDFDIYLPFDKLSASYAIKKSISKKRSYIRIGKNNCPNITDKKINYENNFIFFNNKSKKLVITHGSTAAEIYETCKLLNIDLLIVNKLNSNNNYELRKSIRTYNYNKVLFLEEHLSKTGLWSILGPQNFEFKRECKIISKGYDPNLDFKALAGDREYLLNLHSLNFEKILRNF